MTSYTTKRLSDWINNLDPSLISAYDVPFSIQMNRVEEEDISSIRSLLNSLYERARDLDLRVVLGNSLNKFRDIFTHCTCGGHMRNCKSRIHYAEDVIQKLVAIVAQTRKNKNTIEIVLK